MDIYADLLKKKKEFTKCSKDIFYFATKYVYTLDQAKGERALFPPWKYLEQILNTISEPGDFFLEKSRDMAVSWTVMVFFLYSMLFEEHWAGFAISRKQDEVDDGGDNSTPESLFGRIKFMHSHLPLWMRPEFSFSHLKIRNLDNESYCTGESANPNSGRNVACSFKFADEFAFMPLNDQTAINRAMRFGSYRTLLYVTTAQKGTFAEKISTEGMGFTKIQIQWHLRPDRDKKWYENKIAGSDEEDVASELDISYSASDSSRIVAPFWNEDEGIIPIEELPVLTEYDNIVCGLDYGFLRTVAILGGLLQGKWYMFAELCKYQKTTAEIADLVNELRMTLRIDFPIFCGKDRPDLIEDFHSRGFVATGIQNPVVVRVGVLINVFKAERIVVSEEAKELLKEIPNYRRQAVGGILMETPHKHDVDEAMDAIGYLLMGAGEEATTDQWVSDWKDTEMPGAWVSDDWESSDFSRLQWIHEKG